MKIGIHASALVSQQPTGVEEYVWQLLRHIFELTEASHHQFLLYVPRLGGAQNSRVQELAVLPWVKIRELAAPVFWTQGRLSFELKSHLPDVLFVPAHVLPRVFPEKTVVAIHGLEFEYCPQAYSTWRRNYLSQMTKEAGERAWRVVVPSLTTKNDLIHLYQVPESKIFHIPHGFIKPKPPATQEPFFSEPAPILFLGKIELKKNLLNLIEAYNILRQESDLKNKLYLAGPLGFGAKDILRAADRSPFREDIIFLGFVSEFQKEMLFDRAGVLVLPSWYEGFGLPVLEAQARGIPVVVSLAGALPEIGGRGALYVNPASFLAIAEGLYLLLTQKALRRELVSQGYENLKRFSWNEAARATLDCLLQ